MEEPVLKQWHLIFEFKLLLHEASLTPWYPGVSKALVVYLLQDQLTVCLKT